MQCRRDLLIPVQSYAERGAGLVVVFVESLEPRALPSIKQLISSLQHLSKSSRESSCRTNRTQ